MPSSSSTNFPLRWQTTGDQWWFASPIDCAAANGHCDLVKELLHIDPNLLIKLTSLPRIRRLETLWHDRDTFQEIAKARSDVARNLLRECESEEGHNSLIRAGYGGWLLYAAASAGDLEFAKELLDRDPVLAFGEGEYGVTDLLYAASRGGGNREVFRLLFDCCLGSPEKEIAPVLRSEMVNRAVHAAARGGDVVVLAELLGKGRGGDDVLGYRDAEGYTVLHSSAAMGQIAVVKYLISSYDIIGSVDNRGNTSLNVAAYRGHLAVLELLLLTASPSSASLTNKYGDTFIHMAVAGFLTPSFRRLDRQMELIKQLVSGNLTNVEDIINVRNNEGRTALHMAVMGNIQSDLVELLVSVRWIDLNIIDNEGNTALDLLNQRPRSASSEILIKKLISAGGVSNCQDPTAKINDLVSNHGIVGSPGTSFRIPDAELFPYNGIEDACCSSHYSGETEAVNSPTAESNSSQYKKLGSVNNAAKRLKILLRWRGGRKREGLGGPDSEDNYSIHSRSKNGHIPLRQQFSGPCHKRVLSLQGNFNPTKKNIFTASVRQVLPKSSLGSPSSAVSESLFPSPMWGEIGNHESFSAGPGSLNQSPNIGRMKMKQRRSGSFNLRLMNSYFCFGGQGLAVENSIESQGGQCGNRRSLAV